MLDCLEILRSSNAVHVDDLASLTLFSSSVVVLLVLIFRAPISSGITSALILAFFLCYYC